MDHAGEVLVGELQSSEQPSGLPPDRLFSKLFNRAEIGSK